MRREGYELSIGKPRVITREVDGVVEEPFETLVIEVPPERIGAVMELIGTRRAQMIEMHTRGNYSHIVFSIPARGLIGLRTRLLNATQGTAIIHHRFEKYRPLEGEIAGRSNGVLISMVAGKTVAFGLDGLQDRAELFVGPGEDVYEGMIVGENSRSGDMPVNPTKEKKLTNMRASGSDRNIILKPPRLMSLEMALEYIEEDEIVEVTPDKIRLRKRSSWRKPTAAALADKKVDPGRTAATRHGTPNGTANGRITTTTQRTLRRKKRTRNAIILHSLPSPFFVFVVSVVSWW